MNILSKIFSLFNKNTVQTEDTPSNKTLTKKQEYPIKPHQKNILNLVDQMIKEPELIKDVCQLQTKFSTIDPNDFEAIDKINKKYSCDLFPAFYAQTSALTKNQCKRKNIFYIDNGYRFSFKEKIIDIMMDCSGRILLGDPDGQGQYILDLKRDYQGILLVTSDDCVAITAIYDLVECQLFKGLLNKEDLSDYKYEVDLDNSVFTKYSVR